MADFVIELQHLINRHSMENDSDTPDFILARYMQNCLDAFAIAIRQRDAWYKPKQELESDDEVEGWMMSDKKNPAVGDQVERRPMLPAIGDYVLATKYEDGDPSDMWAIGWYDGIRHDRHYVKDNDGNQIRGNGFRRVARIRKDVGRWLLEVAAKNLECCPPGTVNLWTMLTPAAFEVDFNAEKDTY